MAGDISGHRWCVNAVCETSDGRICSGGEDGLIVLWDASLCPLQNRVAHAAPIQTLTRCDDHLISGDSDGNLNIWDPGMNGNVCMPEKHIGGVSSAIEIYDGRLVTGPIHPLLSH